ncbi:OmpA family protein [Sediminitomix flava]|uniref:Outer membrane protein OmpA-like peptidoglycan-associated protein n=1 Tax=Sediminitomix flava TaxID=379075 RepID=A0A315ZCN6_SEDFL|nr:OmpA family protein [Sediminitomix flava]PWJ42514.1 outer membrane protein OmpA-like peptidoglycan-associated protein [Sediminitomix flava]
MMYQLFKKYILFALVLICTQTELFAQQILWANKILEKSSEMKDHPVSAILKAPDAFQEDLSRGNMWMPSPSDENPSVKIEFSEEFDINQLIVSPNLPPGAISNITIYNKDGNGTDVSSFDYKSLAEKGFGSVVFNTETQNVKAVKVEFLQEKKKLIYIDAIGITNFKNEPIFSSTQYIPTSADITLTKLDHMVNSNSHEVQSFVSQDGNHIYFLRRNHPLNTGGVTDKGDIWESYKDPDTGLWGSSSKLPEPINTRGINILSGVSEKDGERALLLGNHYGKLNSHEGFSIAKNVDDKWEEPLPIKIKDYYNYAEHANFFMSFDQQILIMSIETDFSKGKSDLYVSFRTKKGWSKPKNLGREINSKEEEITPFLLADNKTLFFSSDGHEGLGGKDIFVSYRLDDKWGRWTKPKNLGDIINSELDESDFSMSLDKEQMLFTRSEEQEKGDLFEARLSTHIFHHKIPLQLSDTLFYDSTQTIYYVYEQEITKEKTIITPIINPDVFPEMPSAIELFEGKVFVKGSSKPLDMVLVNSKGVNGIHTIPDPSKRNNTNTVENHIAAKKEEVKEEFQNIEIEENTSEIKESIKHEEQKMDELASNEVSTEPSSVDLEENKKSLTPDELLHNLYFSINDVALDNESITELLKMINFLKKHQDVTLEIAGHTDNLEYKKKGFSLSQKRAKTVANYLKENGISEERIISKGYGAKLPIASNDDEEGGREVNRRVEFYITNK